MKSTQNGISLAEEKEDSQADLEDTSQYHEPSKPNEAKFADSQFFYYDYEELRRRTMKLMAPGRPMAASLERLKHDNAEDFYENNFEGLNGKHSKENFDLGHVNGDVELGLKEESVKFRIFIDFLGK